MSLPVAEELVLELGTLVQYTRVFNEFFDDSTKLESLCSTIDELEGLVVQESGLDDGKGIGFVTISTSRSSNGLAVAREIRHRAASKLKTKVGALLPEMVENDTVTIRWVRGTASEAISALGESAAVIRFFDKHNISPFD